MRLQQCHGNVSLTLRSETELPFLERFQTDFAAHVTSSSKHTAESSACGKATEE